MKMNKHRDYSLLTGSMTCLLVCLTFQVHADSRTQDLSYSPDHWPNRWSSAIRQQQTGKFPSRQKDQGAPPELPAEFSDEVSEQDLFSSQPVYSPSQGRRYSRGDRRGGVNHHFSRQRYSQSVRRNVRDAAFAYHSIVPAAHYNGMQQPFMRNPYAAPMPVMDPVLGHPGIGIPMMPGVPIGYLPGLMPYGYPGNTGMWNPYVSRW